MHIYTYIYTGGMGISLFPFFLLHTFFFFFFFFFFFVKRTENDYNRNCTSNLRITHLFVGKFRYIHKRNIYIYIYVYIYIYSDW